MLALFGAIYDDDVRAVYAHGGLASYATALASSFCYLPHDVVVSPIYAGDAAAAIIELLLDREEGIWHLAAPVAFSWLEHVRRIAYHAGISLAGLTMKSRADLPWMAPRPAFSALASTRGTVIPPLNDSIGRFIETLGLEERSLVHA